MLKLLEEMDVHKYKKTEKSKVKRWILPQKQEKEYSKQTLRKDFSK